ncbi:MAG: acyl carrier protein [Proteobacteria bacterium]|nr:acyl carrier protein [Cystobacterineae bacterium]MCL2259486.1 acyl carrier protein [Cystobacterineae bacterium]MCL2313879.1 acyl carrier protein [Pseudomonadota bacterium]
MTKDEVFCKLKEVLVAEFGLEEGEVRPEAGLSTDLDLDSIDVVDLIVKMKSHISGKMEPEQFKNVKTLQHIVDVLHPLAQ